MTTFTPGHALLIGIGGDLPTTIDDALGLAQIMHDPTRCAYSPDQVQVLTGQEATRTQIFAALDRSAQATDDQATVIIYFSGHGYRVTAGNGAAYYLLPFGYDMKHLS
ncbi:MAG: caspase family protein [Chloroflexaceae bacterium]